MAKITPSLELNRPLNGGTQRLVTFTNGWGASIVKGPYTYGGPEGLYELAVLAFNDENDYDISYTSGITNDVEGYLTPEDVEALLVRIAELPRRLGWMQ